MDALIHLTIALVWSAVEAISPAFGYSPEKNAIAESCKVPSLEYALRQHPPTLENTRLLIVADNCCQQKIADEIRTDDQGKQKPESDRSARGKVECEPVSTWVRKQYSTTDNAEMKRELGNAASVLNAKVPVETPRP